jgi:hypothetical protein
MVDQNSNAVKDLRKYVPVIILCTVMKILQKIAYYIISDINESRKKLTNYL